MAHGCSCLSHSLWSRTSNMHNTKHNLLCDSELLKPQLSLCIYFYFFYHIFSYLMGLIIIIIFMKLNYVLNVLNVLNVTYKLRVFYYFNIKKYIKYVENVFLSLEGMIQ